MLMNCTCAHAEIDHCPIDMRRREIDLSAVDEVVVNAGRYQFQHVLRQMEFVKKIRRGVAHTVYAYILVKTHFVGILIVLPRNSLK